MLSYRHAFHAGNHADVLKHSILLHVLDYLRQKDKAVQIVDTHAGAGRYQLDGEYASKLQEYRGGIGKLWSHPAPAAFFAPYLQAVRSLNPDGKLLHYPGSPWLCHQQLRPQDRLRLFELHSSDHRLLSAQFQDPEKQTLIWADDGLARLKALLPPPSRRGLVLIDPSYELREDYNRIPETLSDALGRFPTGCYAIWYPLLARPEARLLPERLEKTAKQHSANWLNATLSVRKASGDGIGMHGSGMFLINPPWSLKAALQEALPWLAETLAESPGANFSVSGESL